MVDMLRLLEFTSQDVLDSPDWKAPSGQAKEPKLSSDDAYRQIVKELGDLVSHVDVQPPEAGALQDLPSDLSSELHRALELAGIKQVYSHQAQSLQALRLGKDVGLITPTASGKTISFNIGIFEGLMANPSATALYLFPLKALASDQVGKIEEISAGLPVRMRPRVGMMTGDILAKDREELFRHSFPQILAFSPDVLHHQIYKIKKGAEWEQWRQYLRGLKYVVVDEAHTYIGAFGGNFALLLRRLLLAVDKCGGDSSKVQFVFASATVSNPVEMIEKFSGRTGDLELVDKSGAGSKGRTTLCLKPSSQPLREAADIIALWFKYGLSGIVFTNSRNEAKSLYALLRKELGVTKSSQTATYYGGLRDTQRGEIVSKLKSGRLKVIISTSALRAGVDLPSLDACLCLGFPDSLMSYRQQIGRAGRKNPGLILFLPSDKRPMDGYYGKRSDELLHGQVESASFNPFYPSILAKHLMCAAAESGIPVAEVEARFGKPALKVVEGLLDQKALRSSLGKLIAGGYPHFDVSLRGKSASSVRLCDVDNQDETIEEMDLLQAYKEVHTGAIYSAYVNGEMARYECIELTNGKERTARMSRFYDDSLSTYANSTLWVKQEMAMAKPELIDTVGEGKLRLTLGWGTITSAVTGYKLVAKEFTAVCGNRRCSNHKNRVNQACTVCRHPAVMSEKTETIDTISFENVLTTKYSAPILKLEMNPAFKFEIESQVEILKQKYAAEYDEFDMLKECGYLWTARPEMIALHSIAHQMMISLPMLVLSSSYDIDALIVEGGDDADDSKLVSTIGYLFDSVDGGNGATEALFYRFKDFAAKAQSMANACECAHGCPKCLIQGGCAQYNKALNKQVGLFTLGAIQLENIAVCQDRETH